MKKASPKKATPELPATQAITPSLPVFAGQVPWRGRGEMPTLGEMNSALTLILHYCRELLEKFGDGLHDPRRQYVQKILLLAEVGEVAGEERVKPREPKNDVRLSSSSGLSNAAVKTVDLGEISKNIVDGLMLTIPQRRIKFISAISVTAKGNEALLRIALRNLLHNAWRHTSELDETIIELGVAEVEGKAAFFIRNNGPAFDAAEMDEMLSGIDSEGTIDPNGHGVDTAAKIIKSHGGRMWVDEAAGDGSAFYFTI